MYKYLVCNEPDEDIFYRQCSALEARVPGLQKIDVLADVDGGIYAIYGYGDKKITVKNSQYFGEVYIESEVLLSEFFPDAVPVT